MKRLLTIIFALAVFLPIGVKAGGTLIFDNNSNFGATMSVPDTTTNAVYVAADSVNVTVIYQDGTPDPTLDSVWYNSVDAEASVINGQLYYFDAWTDMNGAGDGLGVYTVYLRWLNGTGSTFDLRETYTITQTTLGLEAKSDSLQAVLDSVQAIMAKLILVQDSTNVILDSIQLHDDWVAQQADLAIVKDTSQGTKDLLDAGLSVTVTTNNDKTDYSLTTAERAAVAQAVADSIRNASPALPSTSVDTTESGDQVGVMPDDWSAADSLGFQGVPWDEDTTGHKTPGSFGELATFNDTLNTLATTPQVAQAVTDSIRNASPALPSTPVDTTESGDQVGVMPDDWTAADSLGFQGSASGLTKEQIAQAVADSIRNASPALPSTPVDTTESGDQVGVMPDDWTAADSLGFQGSASGLTKEQIAQAVADSIRNASPALPSTPVDTTESGDQVGVMPDDWTAADSLGFQGSASGLTKEQIAQAVADSIRNASPALPSTPVDTTESGDQVGVMPDDWTAADSLGFQGSASGLTKEQIAQAVADSIRNASPALPSTPVDTTESGDQVGVMPDDWTAADSAGFQGVPWDEDTTGHKTPGSFGELATFNDTLNTLATTPQVAQAVTDSIRNASPALPSTPVDTTESGDQVGVMPDDWTAADSLGFQGSASGLTKEQIAQAVADSIRNASPALPSTPVDTTESGDQVSTITVPDIFTYDVSVYGADSLGKAGERINTGGDSAGWFDASVTPVIAADTNASGETIAVMPDDWTAADSLGFQGSASGLTKEQIAQAVADSIRNASPALPSTPVDTTESGDQVGVMPDDWTAADSAGFQGVPWDEDTTGHKTPGSFGELATFNDTLNTLATTPQVAQAVTDSIRNASPALPSTPVDTTESGDQVGVMPDDWTAADSLGFQGSASGLTKEQIAQAVADSIRNASPALPSTSVDTTESGDQIGVMPDDWTAADSLGFQGSASGLTKEQIAQAVADSIRNASPALPSTPVDTTESGDQVGVMPDDWTAADSLGFQGSASGLTKEQIAQAVADSIRNASPALPSTPVDTTESGDQVGVMPDDWTAADSLGFQGSASGLTKEQIAQAVADSIRNASPALPSTPVDTTESGDQIGVMPDDWTAADSLGFQGSASGLTKEQIAQAVTDSIRNASPALPATAVNCGTGDGPLALTIYAIDSTVTDTLTGIPMTAYNLTGTETWSGTTDVSGSVTFNLTAGSWLIRAGQNSTIWVFDDTSFTASLVYDTVGVLGYPQVILSPTNPDVSRVFGFTYSIFGFPVEGVIVTAELVTKTNVASTSSGFTIGENAGVDTTDAAGFFSFDLVRSVIYDDSTRSFYRFKGENPKKRTKFIVDSVYIPDTGNVDITDEIGTILP